jgi:hypothetical protein
VHVLHHQKRRAARYGRARITVGIVAGGVVQDATDLSLESSNSTLRQVMNSMRGTLKP